MTAVALVGTLDTKAVEHAYVQTRLERLGVEVVLIDASLRGDAAGSSADVDADDVAARAGTTRSALLALGERGAALEVMARGVVAVVGELHAAGRVGGIMALGGSGGASLAAPAMQALPIGVPKLLVSTIASGDTRAWVGGSDIMLLYPVVDVAGLNRISRRVFANAAAAMAGMLGVQVADDAAEDRPVVAATMFGVTTSCVDVARGRLDEHGYDVLVFHATGAGGASMEALIAAGEIDGVLDVTTTELADNLVGGTVDAGPHRLEAAGAAGVPQVVSLGALDMVNFGGLESIPPQYRGRTLYKHNPAVTLMRTDAVENAELGRRIAAKLNGASGPTALFVPTAGVSALSVPGAAFHAPEADAALFNALASDIRPPVSLHTRPTHVNDPAFAIEMADTLHMMLNDNRSQD